MSKLLDLLLTVRDENLTKEQCESYRDQLIHFHTDLQLEIAELEKKQAMFFVDRDGFSDISIKRKWRASDDGQRLLTLNRYTKATVKEIDSLKSRIYSKLGLT